jgi:hypothetical protein
VKSPTRSDALHWVLDLKNKVGARTAVLVVGDGVNIQALCKEPSANKHAWSQILRRIAQRAGLSSTEFQQLPQSTPLLWDILVMKRASHTKTNVDAADLELCKELAVELDRLEHLRSDYPLYQRIGSAWFENIISFNVDRRLALSGEGDAFVPQDGLNGDPVFFRHDVLIRDGRATRIWYPYGDTKNPKTFRLGRGSHADMVRRLEDLRTYLMMDWVGYERKLRLPDIVYRERLQHLSTWYDLFFLAPLIFIGVRLTLESWPIWWLLHQRARNFVPFENELVPATLYLKAKGEDCPELLGEPCEIQTIEFDSHNELWEAFFTACEA